MLYRPKQADLLETIAREGGDALYTGSLAPSLLADLNDIGTNYFLYKLHPVQTTSCTNYILYKLLPLPVQTTSASCTNYFRFLYKLLPLPVQTTSASCTNYCFFYKLLPLPVQTTSASCTNYFRFIHKYFHYLLYKRTKVER